MQQLAKDLERQPTDSGVPVGAETPAEARRGAPPEDASVVGDASLVDIAALATALGTDLDCGLGADEAARRLRADGPNTLPPVPA